MSPGATLNDPMTGATDLVLILGLLAAVAVLAFAIVTILLLAERRRSHARIEQLLAAHARDLTDARPNRWRLFSRGSVIFRPMRASLAIRSTTSFSTDTPA